MCVFVRAIAVNMVFGTVIVFVHLSLMFPVLLIQ